MSKLDREKILDELVSFEGISHSCIYQNEQILASTLNKMALRWLLRVRNYL
jgi:hypothetical protein